MSLRKKGLQKIGPHVQVIADYIAAGHLNLQDSFITVSVLQLTELKNSSKANKILR